MRTLTLLLLAAALPVVAETAPAIPSGPVTYDSVGYESPTSTDDEAASPGTSVSTPISTPSSDRGSDRSYINLNAYTSNYQVRGMGFNDCYTDYGYSSLSGRWVLPNRNLFGRGLRQRIGGEYGCIWNAREVFGDTPLLRGDYAIGKELFPNMMAEIGYSIHHGGAEGTFARMSGSCPHRLAQDVNIGLTYNDAQKGPFGHATAAWGFQGLTGTFYDAELGYRFTDTFSFANWGSDLEISAGIAPSLGYWGSGVEGVDAYRIKAALPLFTHTGGIGRDAHWYLTPWASTAWSGNNARKLDREYCFGPVDHFQFTVGVDCGYRF